MADLVPPPKNPKSLEDNDFRVLKDEFKMDVSQSGNVINNEWVGFEDKVDFREFTIDDPGTFFFNISNLTNKITLTVYSKKDPSQSPSSMTESSLKKMATISTSKTKETKPVILDPGTYYVKIEYKGSSKTMGTHYNLDVQSTLFTKRNNADDEFKNGALSPDYTVSVDGPGRLINNDWVGYGDKIDCRRLNIAIPGAYRFFMSAITNKVKITVYSMTLDSKGNEKLKKLHSVTGSANNIKGTKELFMDTGVYYLTVEAPDYKKGRNTDYSVDVSGVAYYQANKTDDNWDDIGVPSYEIGGVNQVLRENEWVGFGDKIDWVKINISTPGYYNFALKNLEQKAKMTVWNITTSTSGKVSKKSLGSITVNPTSSNYAMLKKLLLLDRGTYYISIEASGWKTGKNTAYELSSMAGELYVKADDGANNFREGAQEILLADGGIKDDYVGFGDFADNFFFRIPEDASGKYDFLFNAKTGMANLKIILYTGSSYKTLDTLKPNEMVTLELDSLKVPPGSLIYLEITSADKGKGKKNTDYDIQITHDSFFSRAATGVSALSAENEFSGNKRTLLNLA